LLERQRIDNGYGTILIGVTSEQDNIV